MRIIRLGGWGSSRPAPRTLCCPQAAAQTPFPRAKQLAMTRKLTLVLVTFLGLVVSSAATQAAPAPAKRAAPAKRGAVKPPATKGVSADELAAGVQGFYDKTSTFKARFKQRYYIAQYRKTIDSTGQVVFQKPGKMSWRYTNNGNRVVSDGTTIKVYEKDNRQMFVQQIAKSPYPAALSFLVGGGDLRKEFALRKLDAAKMGFEGGFVLEGRPRQPTPAYQTMLFYIDAATHQVRRVLLLDAQGNRNRFDFVNPVVNVKPPAGEFTFVPPPGTKIIRP
jgi:outer membrane lipoprotein carrier protein